MLETDYERYIHRSRYARWRDDLGRRETWEETVKRLIHFWVERHGPEELDYDKLHEIEDAILNLDIMPSMRSLMTAGPALDRDHVAGYNCAFIPIEDARCFDELMYILLCGTGVGFSVERQYVNKMPEVSEEFHETDTTISVADSKIGWASAFRELISLLYAGKVPQWDMSKIREAGARLKTFGGRASGPEPLESLFSFTVSLFKRAAGRRLNSIECHDLVCKVAEIVVVGGVRRSALISLSNLSDDRMRNAKNGQWWVDNPQRALANNSYVADERPDFEVFLNEWRSLYQSHSGERGIFSREACKRTAAKNGRRDTEQDFGTNPCSEIILRPYQFCNLTEVVIRPTDSLDDLRRKVELATILGTFQSTLTDFRYLRKKWRNNCEEERLLGVSLTGICDHPVMGTDHVEAYSKKDAEIVNYVTREWLEELKSVAVETNKTWADILGIQQSAAITCVKPSGTVSQLVDSASGIHPRYSRYYIRRVRNDKKDPLSQFLIDSGVPYEDDVTNNQTYVFSFPMKAPDEAIVAGEMTAEDQLKLWQVYADHWCEHKPSMTAYYTDDNFLSVGDWVWNNFDAISGISFLPHADHVYQQAPYETINEEAYNKLVAEMPDSIDWDKLAAYESTDNTVGSQELACAGGVCEV